MAHLYVSFQDDDRIAIFTQDPATGAVTRWEDAAVEGGPAPMALSPDKRVLHVGRRGSQQLSSFAVDPRTGGLSLIRTVPLQGEPVYVATDRSGRFVLSAYYYQSTAAVHAVGRDGAATFPPVEWRFTAHGAHAILTDRSNRFAYVPHIANRGPNAIFQFTFDEATGRLTPAAPARYAPEAYLGPPGPRISPRPRRRLLFRRAGGQRQRLRHRHGRRDLGPAPDHLHVAGRLHRAEHVLADSDAPVRTVSLRPEPRAQQRGELRRRSRIGPVDGDGGGSRPSRCPGRSTWTRGAASCTRPASIPAASRRTASTRTTAG